MSVPDKVRQEVKHRLWDIADRVGWMNLSPSAKARLYEQWTRHSEIGGVLARFVDKGRVRVYIKDTLLKDYAQAHLANPSRIFRILGFPNSVTESEAYVKPHGRKLQDGRVVCWGRAEDWKTVLMAVYERAYCTPGAKPFAAVLFQATGRFDQENVRSMVQDAASKLGIHKLKWVESNP